MKYLISIIGLSITFTSLAFAEGAWREVTVTKLHPIANVRPHSGGSDITRVYVNGGAWGNTTCRSDAGDLQKDDTHLLSQLLWAMSTRKKIKIEVNDTLRPVDTVCQITALFIE